MALPAQYERFIEESVAGGLRAYLGWKDLGGPKLVRLQVGG